MSNSHLENTDDLKVSLMRGAVWAVGMRWTGKTIGLLSTVILARVLQPQDYGVVSMAFLVVGLVETFLNTGAGAALVRLGKEATTDQINSAWTLRGLQGIVMALALAAVSPFAAEYFNEPRVTQVLLIVCVCQVFMGFSNIGMSLAYRDLQFAVEFKLSIYTKLISVSVTLLTALYFRDYRGLVAGIVAGFVVEWVLSYYLHPYRPKWCVSKIGDIWAISKWLMVTGIGGFFLRKSDQLMAGRIGSTREYGLYSVGADIGQLPAGELGPALTRPLYPILTAMRHDWERAKAATLKTLSSVNSITMPLGFGMAAVSEQFTPLLLGQQWLGATPFVAGFAIIGVGQYLTSPLSTLLNVAGHVRVQSRIVWIEFLAFVALAFILTPIYHLEGLMIARIASGLVQSVLMMIAARTYTGILLRSTLGSLLRPFAGAITMYLILVTWGNPFSSNIAILVANVMLGAVIYTTWLLLTWHFSKRPDGLESTIIDFLKKKLN